VRLAHLCLGTLVAAVVFGGAWLLDRAWIEVVQGWLGQSDWASPFEMFSAFWPTGGQAEFPLRVLLFREAISASGWTPGLVLVLALVILSVGLGAIARSTAIGLSSGQSIGLRASLKFAFSCGQRLAVAVVVPCALIFALVVLIVLVRFVLFAIGFMQPIGATLFIIPLLLGLAAAIVLVLFSAGHGMLAPAVGVENTDGVDAVQRSWGYIIARPIRFAFYFAVAAVVLGVAYWVFQMVCRVGIDLSMLALPRDSSESRFGEPGYATGAIDFWLQMLWLIFIGWVISFYGCASTIVYLLMRLACDEQDVTVVWLASTKQPSVTLDAPVEPEADLEL